jgi:hypothetical protein
VRSRRWSGTQRSNPILCLWSRQTVQVGNLDTVAIGRSCSECDEFHEVDAVHFAPERCESPCAGFAMLIVVAPQLAKKVSAAEGRRKEPDLLYSLLCGAFSREAEHQVLRFDDLKLRCDGVLFWSLVWTHISCQCDDALCADPGSCEVFVAVTLDLF